MTQHSYVHEEKREKTKCPLCKYEVSRKSDLPKHIKNVHEGKRDHKCQNCGKEYTDKKNLNQHIKRVHEDHVRDEQCTQCGTLFFTKEVLNRHVKYVHDTEQNPKLLKCEFCGKGFTKNRMQRHLKVHKGSRDYVCHICKYLLDYLNDNFDIFRKWVLINVLL